MHLSVLPVRDSAGIEVPVLLVLRDLLALGEAFSLLIYLRGTGSREQIPYANNAACSSGRAYPIREGDNLFRIGVNNGTTAEILRQINGFDANYSIDAGSAMCLP